MIAGMHTDHSLWMAPVHVISLRCALACNCRLTFEDASMDRATARQYIEETCGPGWRHLLDDMFDNAPEGIVIEQV